ncbi:putative Ino eighty subunit 1 [Glarea lozoyensis 74030]|uniref:Putative Ino eighty subunit 1 n=1 Tax=Glarea lozoyensis (strain ATCC 74030 / MF5533) TaxID=1104152 RepID=H0EDS0_GLAL7|nr:putative Ino eighty subunit 1 [Glarea lozoyensis 74030]
MADLSVRSSADDSTIDADDHNTTQQSSPIRADPRSSLHHVLDNSDSRPQSPSAARMRDEVTEDEDGRTPREMTQEMPSAPSAPTTAGGRKKKEAQAAALQGSSLYVGNKVRHLKKDDGEPLWRKDIQYDFLKRIFEDDTKCFTNPYEPEALGKQTFANLYIDAMARSIFPEMRAQLRTYHAIPSLQAHQDPNSYKQLQDAPRLKSILKGASEDQPEPNSLEGIKRKDVPRTNPVNLIFVLAQFAPKVTELHFPPPLDFYDLIMRTQLSSESRAKAFLWLMWFYLESDFTEEGAEENPFGAGVDYGVDVRNQGVPHLKPLDSEEEALENVDTPEEVEYGVMKQRERKRIIEADQAAFQAEQGPPKRGPKPKLHLPPDDGGPSPAASLLGRMRPKFSDDLSGSPVAMLGGRGRAKYDSDMDSTRSTPPPRALGGRMGIHSVLNTGRGRGNLKYPFVDGSSPVPHPEGVVAMRRSRPLTAHQLAVERNRNQRVDYILSRGLRKQHHQARKNRKREGAFFRALLRSNLMPHPYDDSEGEESLARESAAPFRERGFGGLVQLEAEPDDFGEEMAAYSAAFRRAGRRLDRWESRKDLKLGVMGTMRVSQIKSGDSHDARDNDETEDEQTRGLGASRRNGKQSNEENLDDMDKEILGLDNDEDDEMELDDVEKDILGINGDETEVDEMFDYESEDRERDPPRPDEVPAYSP